MKRIGILGGTFDPPHNGHLLIANEVLHALNLDEIWFMPTNIPPHKKSADLTNNEDRVKMLSLAISNNPSFKLQRIELERDGPSYTYETMRILKEHNPDIHFYFIIGADMVEYLPNWYNIDELVKVVNFVGIKRPGFTFGTKYDVTPVEAPQFDVSSSMLRKRFKERRSTMYLLPETVKHYIEEKSLYGPQAGS